MSLRLTAETLHLSLRDPFRIARSDEAAAGHATTVIVELRDDRYPGIVGVGEGFPDAYYCETPETMDVVRGLSADIPPTDFTIGIDEPAIVAERASRAAARCSSRRRRSATTNAPAAIEADRAGAPGMAAR